MQPGTYDVAVYAKYGNTPTTLSNALTYQAIDAPGGGGSTSPTAPSAPATPSSPSAPGSSPAPSAPTSPGGSPGAPTASPTPTASSAPTTPVTPAPTGPAQPAPSDQPTDAATQPSTITGPGGLHLVRVNVNLDWNSTACSANDCDGTPL
jgi:hypothetical protein